MSEPSSSSQAAAADPHISLSVSNVAFEHFAQEFATETDRAAVILGAAKLDLTLQQILEAFFLPSASGRDELLEGDSPLATFSSRINVCYRLGIIDASFARCLHLVRRIRNSFAHESSGVSLESGAHADRVRELIVPFQQHGAFQWLLDEYFKKPLTRSQEFRGAVALLCLRLEGRFEQTESVSTDNAFNIIPPRWDKKFKKTQPDPPASPG